MTRFDMRCSHCRVIYENVQGPLGTSPQFSCPRCGRRTERFFGGQINPLNFGERPWHDDIAQFQFRNL